MVKSKRRQRISRGAGVKEGEVKDMLRQYFGARKVMKSRQGRRLLKMLRRGGGGFEDLLK